MSPTALRIHSDFVRLAAEEPCSLYCEELLRHGVEAVPQYGERFPQLHLWNGIPELKARISETLAGSADELQVFLSSRTGAMMALAAELMGRRCRSVLVPDVVWPPYLQALRDASRRYGFDVQLAAVLRRVQSPEFDHRELRDLICSEFHRHRCDGLFVPSVSHTGIRLPVGDVVRSLNGLKKLTCSVVDASQAFGHIDTAKELTADFVLGGSHKWLRSYLPLGIGLSRNQDTAEEMRKLVRDVVDDSLLRTVESWVGDVAPGPRETVNVTPLLSCRGALEDATVSDWRRQQSNRELADRLLRRTGWTPCTVHDDLESGIILAQAKSVPLRRVSPTRIRQAFCAAGIAVTSYAGGFVRLSMPFTSLTQRELDILEQGLRLVSAMSTNRKASRPVAAFATPIPAPPLAPQPFVADSPIAGY